nr:hypothetical protein GGBNIMDK_00048 [Bacillus cereus]
MEKLKEWMYKRLLKQQLIEAFQKAGVYREHQTRGGKISIYPKVHAISSSKESVKYVFTIPIGLDPKTIEKKWFCFQQILGRNVAIEGDIKRFVLYVFHSDGGLKPYNYSYKQWQPLLKQHRLPVVVGRDQLGTWLKPLLHIFSLREKQVQEKVVWCKLSCLH